MLSEVKYTLSLRNTNINICVCVCVVIWDRTVYTTVHLKWMIVFGYAPESRCSEDSEFANPEIGGILDFLFQKTGA